MTDTQLREAWLRRLANLANSMCEAMSQGGTHKIFVDPETRDDVLAAIAALAIPHSPKPFDIQKYLAVKAQENGLTISPPPAGHDDVRTVYLMHRGEGIVPRNEVAISISGLEQIQNATEESIKNLLDCRFNNALKMFLKHERL